MISLTVTLPSLLKSPGHVDDAARASRSAAQHPTAMTPSSTGRNQRRIAMAPPGQAVARTASEHTRTSRRRATAGLRTARRCSRRIDEIPAFAVRGVRFWTPSDPLVTHPARRGRPSSPKQARGRPETSPHHAGIRGMRTRRRAFSRPCPVSPLRAVYLGSCGHSTVVCDSPVNSRRRFQS